MAGLNGSHPKHDEVDRVVAGLVASTVLTSEQAQYLLEIWPEVESDSFAHPALRNVGDHTRALLERMATARGEDARRPDLLDSHL